MKNILALIDFSDSSSQVVDKACEMAKNYGAKCWLIHVASPNPEFVGYEIGPQYIRDSRADELKQEHEQLQFHKKILIDRGVDCEALLIQGPINETIAQEIKKLEADLVVAGSHGRSRLYDLLVGSVAEYLIKNIDVPILLIPQKGTK
ncbi:MAG: universal stress protein [Saprospiraceae bacterium]|nr:universal stress protein [Saprospiraceae bacterium]